MAQKILPILSYISVSAGFLIAIFYKNWAAVAAIAAIGAVFVAIQQAGLSRMSMTADLMMRLESRFEDQVFIEKRKKAAFVLLRPQQSKSSEQEDVFDFFETLGLLVRRDALDKEFAHSGFFYWLHGYYRWGRKFIEEQQKIFPNRYTDLIWLHNELLAIEKSKGLMNESEWDHFLEEESKSVYRPAIVGK